MGPKLNRMKEASKEGSSAPIYWQRIIIIHKVKFLWVWLQYLPTNTFRYGFHAFSKQPSFHQIFSLALSLCLSAFERTFEYYAYHRVLIYTSVYNTHRLNRRIIYITTEMCTTRCMRSLLWCQWTPKFSLCIYESRKKNQMHNRERMLLLCYTDSAFAI